MKLSTDAVLLGAFAPVDGVRDILDIGTGCGVIALMLAQRCPADIKAIDIDPGSVADAQENFTGSPWHDRLEAIRSSLQEFATAEGRKFDLIVCNPPFFQNSLRSPHPDRNLARHDEQMSLAMLAHYLDALLQDQGKCCVILPDSEEKNFGELMGTKGLTPSRRRAILPGASKKVNRVLLEYSRTALSFLEEEPLVIREEEGHFSAAYREFTKDFYLAF